ncbi:MAG TPA: substrate-binding domain-containing protein [Candidatus Methanoperedens sp.]|nr:substrate-binding domain-containing protein [Candidatus Methanoperedens sp.]
MGCRQGVAALIALLVCAAHPTPAAGAQRLTASGCSVSNTGYLSELAADYERISGVKMFIRGGGSVIGLEDLASGASDFAAACRGRSADDPADLEFVQVAWDALVFIVHPSNPVDSIAFAEAAAVYDGSLRDWSRLKGPAGPILVFLQRPTRGLSGVENSLRSQILRGRQPAAGPYVTELASTGIVEQLVEKTPRGFGASGFSSARKRAVKMLAIDGVKPTKEAIVERAYLLRRPLYLIVKKPAQPAVRAFLDFVLSKQGQDLLGSHGAISLREMR